MQLIKSYPGFALPPADPIPTQWPETLLGDGIDSTISASRFVNNIQVGGSPGTLGTIVEIDASTSAAAGGLWFTIGNIVGNNRSGRLQFCTGSGGSEVEWASVHLGYATLRETHFVPGYIPSGTRLSVRHANSAGGTDRYGIYWGLMPRDPVDIGAPLMIGNTGSNQRGVTLATPGATNSKGDWTELDPSVDDDLCALMVCIQMNNETTVTAANMLVDIGIGAAAAETVLIGDLWIAPSATPAVGRRSPLTYAVDVPVGSRLSARFARSVADDLIDVCCVGGTLA